MGGSSDFDSVDIGTRRANELVATSGGHVDVQSTSAPPRGFEVGRVSSSVDDDKKAVSPFQQMMMTMNPLSVASSSIRDNAVFEETAQSLEPTRPTVGSRSLIVPFKPTSFTYANKPDKTDHVRGRHKSPLATRGDDLRLGRPHSKRYNMDDVGDLFSQMSLR